MDPKGPWKADPITAHNYYAADYTITKPNGEVIYRPKDRYWAYSEASIRRFIEEDRILWGEGSSMPMVKRYLCDVQNGLVPVTLFKREFAGDTSQAKRQIDELFPESRGIFDYTKSVDLMYRLAQISSSSDDIVIDFFSGSATTAHAVMQLNAEDGGHRKFIMVQLPEATDEGGTAYKAGYENICEIGKERIRRAGTKIAAAAGEKAAGLDLGFRCLRLDTSNMTEVYYAPDAVTQDGLFAQVDNVKADRTPEDLLFQTMLDLGILLSEPITVEEVAGRRVFNVADGFLLACFDRDVTDEVVTSIAQRKPYYAVFRDASMADD
ncbi:MAG: site-specific DNA-methyltransferase, partial [Selenomonas sp.]|nr:site-specific DNA-methyltransferase [Selenomonas sp.]